MAFLAGPLMAVAAGAQVVGALTQSSAQAGAARYNAQVAQQNAAIALDQGNAAAAAQNREARRKIGAAIASYGASGVDGSSGSPMDVLADSVRAATLDNLTVQYNYKLKALGYENQATLDKASAKNYETAGVLNAVGSAAKGFGSAIPYFG